MVCACFSEGDDVRKAVCSPGLWGGLWLDGLLLEDVEPSRCGAVRLKVCSEVCIKGARHLHHRLDSKVVVAAEEFGDECGPYLQTVGHLRFVDAECLHSCRHFFCKLQDRGFDPEAVSPLGALDRVVIWLLSGHGLSFLGGYWSCLLGGEVRVSRFSGLRRS